MSKKRLKILVIRFSSIGDIVLTTPVIRVLSQQLQAEVHYCTKEEYALLLENNPYLTKIHTLTQKRAPLIRQLRKENFDYLIDLHNNLRTFFIKSALGVKSYHFSKLNIEKFLYVHLKWNLLPRTHIVDRYMATVAPLGVKDDSKGLDYFIPEKVLFKDLALPETFKKGYVAYVIGGTWATKQLPFEQMIALCDKIARPIILLGGEEEKRIGDKVAAFFEKSHISQIEDTLQAMGKHTKIFNGCGRFHLHEAALILREAICVFTHDTGLMHIAAAFKKQIFSIWGNTVPEFGMYPYRTNFSIYERKGLSCRPCSKIGYKQCPKKHFRCMRDIHFDISIPD